VLLSFSLAFLANRVPMVIQDANLHATRHADIQTGKVGDYQFFIMISERWARKAESGKRSKKICIFFMEGSIRQHGNR
jgi:hypothetical protein